MASVSRVRVDDDGIFAATRGEIVLDVLFDERRIWSFWLIRDGEERDGGHHVAWPPALARFLDGTTRLALVEHVSGDRGLRRGGDPGQRRRRAPASRSSTPRAGRSAWTRATASRRPSTPAATSTWPRSWTPSRRCSRRCARPASTRSRRTAPCSARSAAAS